jgi:dephospho-CoA kinase
VPVETQRTRLLARDGIDAVLAERMISAQATREQRLAIADDVVVNNGTLEDLQRRVAALDLRYRGLAAGG